MCDVLYYVQILLHYLNVPVVRKLKKWLSPSRLKHCQLLIVFFIFSVGLLSADIITDIMAAAEFFKRGDTNWGWFTLIPIFAPFLVRLMMNFIRFCRCFELKKTPAFYFYLPTTSKKKNKYHEWKSELKLLKWHFPMFQPIR